MRMPAEQALDLDELNRLFERSSPTQILAWAAQTFGCHVLASSSFQTQSLPLLHMLSQVAPQIPILFLDTGFHFTETLEFRDQLVQEWRLTVHNLECHMGHASFLRQEGELYRRDPQRCCAINKLEPLDQALRGQRAWITGIRRDQTAQRSGVKILTRRSDGLIKICPLATWARVDIAGYIQAYDLPQHPLAASGYRSIGCRPCTQPAAPGADERSGRWAGTEISECGLHFCVRRQEA